MLTMHYRLVLPAAFDMEVIRHRIATKGPLLDRFAGLVFKAYLYACQGEHGPENLYAPFYLWADNAAMNRFLFGPGFAALSQDFGWPVVHTGSVLLAELTPQLRAARFATHEVITVAPHTALTPLAEAEGCAARAAVVEGGALAAVAAFEPTTWTLTRFRLWDTLPRDTGAAQRYAVGHVSTSQDV